MRITTQMLYESARKAGRPINNNSLLNYINNDSSQLSVMNALNKNHNVVDTEKRSNYEKLEKAAEQLFQKAEVFSTEGENSIFAKAKESGSNQQIYDAAEALVENYNNTIKTLKTGSGALNDFYRQMLQETATENSEALKNIGITIAKDGTAVIDQEKMKTADIDSLEKALGPNGNFSKKVAFLAERIADHAEANAESLTSQYNSSGNLYSAMSGKYDFWG